MLSLSSADREFLSSVYDSARLNPFSAERLSSDAAAVGRQEPDPSFEHIPDLLDKLDRRLGAILAAPGATWRDFPADEAALVETAVLFLVFHRHSKSLDDYIHEQCESPGAAIPADCGAAIFADLRARGFPVARAERCVSVFFQMRRAFFFITNGLVGECDSMRRLRIELWNAVFTSDLRLYLDTLWDRMDDFSVLLLGETGTGKGAAAMAVGRSGYIPYLSQRRAFSENFNETFLALNLSEFSESLIESELFGHVKGAFTGAIGDHAGIFSRCSRHGAIFLDEIGDISEHVQIKLLQVLQQRLFSPVGGHGQLRFGGRIIAATNQDLAKRRAEGTFRNDFYYRLSSSHIALPSLRRRIAENQGELRLLIDEIVRRLAGAPNGALASRIEERLSKDLPEGYLWPGNVRELEQAVRSIIVTGHYFGESSAATARSGETVPPELWRILSGAMTLDELDTWYCRHLFARVGTYHDVARRLGIDWRTVKQKIAGA